MYLTETLKHRVTMPDEDSPRWEPGTYYSLDPSKGMDNLYIGIY